MKGQFKRCFRMFGLWQLERECKWLTSMAAKGWHLKKVSPCFYLFSKGEPKDVLYHVDFRIAGKDGLSEYLQLFADANWQFVANMGIWYYFLSMPQNKYKEVYSDNRSLLERFQRLALVHIIFLGPIIFPATIIVSKRVYVTDGEWAMAALLAVLVVLMVITALSLLRIVIAMVVLKNRLKE